jgi:hypothetical protein
VPFELFLRKENLFASIAGIPILRSYGQVSLEIEDVIKYEAFLKKDIDIKLKLTYVRLCANFKEWEEK